MIERTVCTPRVHAALISNKHLLIQPRGNLNVNVEISAHEPESRGRKLLLIACKGVILVRDPARRGGHKPHTVVDIYQRRGFSRTMLSWSSTPARHPVLNEAVHGDIRLL